MEPEYWQYLASEVEPRWGRGTVLRSDRPGVWHCFWAGLIIQVDELGQCAIRDEASGEILVHREVDARDPRQAAIELARSLLGPIPGVTVAPRPLHELTRHAMEAAAGQVDADVSLEVLADYVGERGWMPADTFVFEALALGSIRINIAIALLACEAIGWPELTALPLTEDERREVVAKWRERPRG